MKNKFLKWIVRQLPSGQKENLPVTAEELLIAIAISDERTIRKLLQAGLDPNLSDHMGRFPLHMAVKHCLPNVIKSLVFAGADVNLRDEEEQNALMIALDKNDHECARELLRLGINLSARNLEMQTALDIAIAKNNQVFIELIQYFQSTRSTMERQTAWEQSKKFGQTLDLDLPLLPHLPSQEELDIQEQIITDKEARLNKAKSAYQRRIEKARKFAANNRKETSQKPFPKPEKIKSAPADLRQIAQELGCLGKNRNYTLIQAIRQHQNDYVKTMLSMGISLERVEPQTLMTPLAAAVIYKNQTAITQLLEKNAQADTVYRKHSLLFYAIRIGGLEIVKCLLEAGARPEGKPDSPTPLCLAIKKNKPDLCRLLLEMGADANYCVNSETAIKTLITHDRLPLLPLLVEFCADLNDSELTGRSSLSWAMLYKKNEIFEALLQAGADINAGREKGESILSLCIRGEHLGFLDRILAAGVDVNIIDKYGKTPLTLAVHGNRTELVEKLLAAGAVINMVDGNDQTAINLAKVLKGRERILDLLENV